VTRDWRKLLNVELHKFYSSPIIIRIINSRKKTWAGYVVRMKKICTGFRWESQKERDRLEDLDVPWRIILRWILKG
jgi:hypothetical protein